jgi:hypothetical protein
MESIKFKMATSEVHCGSAPSMNIRVNNFMSELRRENFDLIPAPFNRAMMCR